SPATAAAQHTTAPIMIAATGPSADLLPSSTISISDANRIVAMVMPETGLFEEPTRPAMYADTDENRKPATIITSVIGIETKTLWTIAWYSTASGSVNKTSPISTAFIGRSFSVSSITFAVPARVAARPLRTPDNSEERSENSVQMPPTSIAPTPR